jgi:hypothetical protein
VVVFVSSTSAHPHPPPTAYLTLMSKDVKTG